MDASGNDGEAEGGGEGDARHEAFSEDEALILSTPAASANLTGVSSLGSAADHRRKPPGIGDQDADPGMGDEDAEAVGPATLE